MKLVTLLTLLPIIYSERITLDSSTATGITSYEFSTGNPDATQIGIIQDDNIQTAYGAFPAFNNLDGTFQVKTLNPGVPTYEYYQITALSITFQSDCDISGGQYSASPFYYAPGSTTKTILPGATVTEALGGGSDSSKDAYTFTATLPSGGVSVDNDNGIGFDVIMKSATAGCEGEFDMNEFVIEGTAVLTAEPTASPSTAEPTPSPTRSCKGEITWGDPHYSLIGFGPSVGQLNYQGMGWYYYVFPCDMDDYTDWPFFLLSRQDRCWYRGSPKSCIQSNRIVINTKPDAWIFAFTDNGFEIIQVGTDVAGRTAADFNTNIHYRKNNPLVIDYDDGGVAPGVCATGSINACQQAGELRIFYEGGDIVFEFWNVKYLNKPRSCNRGEVTNANCPTGGLCEDKLIEIRNSGTWTVFTCPHCFRNIACGIMGRYYRGDCRSSDLRDPSSQCYEIMHGSNGQIYTPPNNDATFAQFADTWDAEFVKGQLEANGLTEISGLRDGGSTDRLKWDTLKKREGKMIERDGRMAPDLKVNDTSFYDGDCKNNMEKIREVNETCRLNTVVKYERCCKEIEICPLLWKACIEDLCSCASDVGATAGWDEAKCLDRIIHDSMNTTCSWDALWPTATPTASPTPSPTGLVAGLPRGKKAMDLIWLYLIFVIVFVLIAGGAYWYYRKKNKVQVEFPQDDEQAEMQAMEQGGTNTQVYA